MKRAVSLILALVLCLGMCACGGDSSESSIESTEPLETISMEDLFADLENRARAQLNVGKETTVFGQITDVTAEYCDIELMQPKNSNVLVYMEIETLAEFSVDDFVAITGIVSSVGNIYDTYNIKGSKVEDTSVMDTIFRNYLADTEAKSSSDYPLIGYYLKEDYRVSFLEEYASFRDDAFIIRDDTELKNYLIGKWEHGTYVDYTLAFIETVEFKADGTYFWDKSSSWDQDGDWSVSNGYLDSFMGFYPPIVYVLTDNLFFCQGQPHIRINESQSATDS